MVQLAYLPQLYVGRDYESLWSVVDKLPYQPKAALQCQPLPLLPVAEASFPPSSLCVVPALSINTVGT